MLLFGQHQTYSEALRVPCRLLLELVEMKLDEGLSYLEGDGPRLARQELAIEREFGSVEAYRAEMLKLMRKAPEPPKNAQRKTI